MRSQITTTLCWVSATAGLLLVIAGGGMMLIENIPAGGWLVGLNLLSFGALSFVVAAFGVWLTRSPRAASDVTVGVPLGLPVPRLVFVVRRDRRDLFEVLRASLAREENVHVVIDRRDRPRDAFDREVIRRGWSVARVGI